jgi:hypothetical protein
MKNIKHNNDDELYSALEHAITTGNDARIKSILDIIDECDSVLDNLYSL